MRFLRNTLLFIMCCMIVVGCALITGQGQAPQSRIEIGMSREMARAKLNDALKHYECAGYNGAMDDLFLYGAANLKDATIVYVKSKTISGTLTVHDFGIAENYLLPAAYGNCLGLLNSNQSQQ